MKKKLLGDYKIKKIRSKAFKDVNNFFFSDRVHFTNHTKGKSSKGFWVLRRQCFLSSRGILSCCWNEVLGFLCCGVSLSCFTLLFLKILISKKEQSILLLHYSFEEIQFHYHDLSFQKEEVVVLLLLQFQLHPFLFQLEVQEQE